MELYQLEDLIAVVEERSFTRAAERVLRTQAAVSIAIKKLEEEMGTQLIMRDSRGCTLTGPGERMLQYAKQMLELRNEMRHALAEFTTLGTGTVSIAAHESVARYLLPHPMAAFHTRFPDIRIETRLCGVDEIASMVAERIVDLGFGVRPPEIGTLRSELVLTDPLVLVVAPEHPLASREGLEIADLRREKFFTHHLRTRTVDAIQDLFRSHDVEFHVVAELWNFETIKEFVKAGSGIAIIPLSVARQDAERGSLVVVPVDGLHLARQIEVVYRDKRRLLPAPAELVKVLSAWPWNEGHTLPLERVPPAVAMDVG